MKRSVLIAAIGAAIVSTPAWAFEVFTDFEFTDTDGFFTIGTPPISADFLNGAAQTIGAPLLYHSGMNSWMINTGQTGEILFDTPAALVDLWLRDQTDDAASVLTFFAPDDSVLAQFNGATSAFQHITVEGVGSIARITLENTGATFGYTVIDDFGFNTIPAPSGAALMGLAGLALLRRRRG